MDTTARVLSRLFNINYRNHSTLKREESAIKQPSNLSETINPPQYNKLEPIRDLTFQVYMMNPNTGTKSPPVPVHLTLWCCIFDVLIRLMALNENYARAAQRLEVIIQII